MTDNIMKLFNTANEIRTLQTQINTLKSLVETFKKEIDKRVLEKDEKRMKALKTSFNELLTNIPRYEI